MSDFETLSMPVDTSGLLKAAAAFKDLRIEAAAASKGIEASTKNVSAATKRNAADVVATSKAYRTLKASIDPLYAAQKKYAEGFERIKKAQAKGLINNDEAAAQMAKLERVFKAYEDIAIGAAGRIEAAQSKSADRAAKEVQRALDKQTSAHMAASRTLTALEASSAKSMTRALASEESALEGAARSYQNLRAQIDPAYAAELMFAQGAAKVNIAVARGVVTQEEANATLARLEMHYSHAEEANNLFTTSLTNFSTMSRRSRANVQQLSYQLQDVAIQFQAGQNPMIIFAQQGSQIASLFGAEGALFGAMLSFGLLIGQFLVPSLMEGKTAEEKMKEATDALAKGVTDYTKAVDEAGMSTWALDEKFGSLASGSMPAVLDIMQKIAEVNLSKKFLAIDTNLKGMTTSQTNGPLAEDFTKPRDGVYAGFTDEARAAIRAQMDLADAVRETWSAYASAPNTQEKFQAATKLAEAYYKAAEADGVISQYEADTLATLSSTIEALGQVNKAEEDRAQHLKDLFSAENSQKTRRAEDYLARVAQEKAWAQNAIAALKSVSVGEKTRHNEDYLARVAQTALWAQNALGAAKSASVAEKARHDEDYLARVAQEYLWAQNAIDAAKNVATSEKTRHDEDYLARVAQTALWAQNAIDAAENVATAEKTRHNEDYLARVAQEYLWAQNALAAAKSVATAEKTRHNEDYLARIANEQRLAALQAAYFSRQYANMGASRLESQKSLDLAKQELSIGGDKLKLLRLAAFFGKDSIQYAKAQNAIDLASYTTRINLLKVADSIKQSMVAQFVETQNAESATIGWANAMASVKGEIQSIMGLLSSIAGTIIDNASKNAQLTALKAGKSAVEAANASRDFRANIEQSARVASADSWWGKGLAMAQNYFDNVGTGLDDQIVTQQALNAAADKAGKAAETAAEKADKAWTKSAQTPIEKYIASISELKVLLASGEISQATFTRSLASTRGELADSIPLVNDLATAWGDFVAGGLKDFKSFEDAVLGSFKNMIAQMIATAMKAKLMSTLGIGADGTVTNPTSALGQILGGFNGVTAAGGGGMGASFGSLGSLLGMGGGVAGVGAGAGAAAGAAGAAAGATSMFASLGAAMPAIGAVILGLQAIIGTKEVTAKGVTGTLGSDGASARKYEDSTHSTFFGLFRKDSTKYSSASDGTIDYLNTASTAARKNIQMIARSFGLGAIKIGDIVSSFKVNLMGMSKEDAAAALGGAVSEYSDAMASLVLATGKYTKEGETSTAVLERLYGTAGAVNLAMDTLGGAFEATTLRTADMASQLVDLFGGLDSFKSSIEAYYQAFYSEEERIAITTRQLTKTLADLGVAMPISRGQFRALIDSADLTTESGRELYATLVKLASSFDFILPKIGDLTQALEDLVGSLSGKTGDMLSMLADAQNNAQGLAKSWYDAAKSLRDFVSNFLGQTSDVNSEPQAMAYNQMKFQTLLASTLAGNQQAAKDLSGVAATLLDNIANTSGSSAEARVAQAKVLSDLGFAANVEDIYGAQQDVIAGLLGQEVTLLTDLKNYLAAGGVLDPAHLTALGTQLASLQGAITAAQAVDYASIMVAMGVTISIIDGVTDPALKALLTKAANGVTATIDFIVRKNGLSPSERWLALNAETKRNAIVEFVANSGDLTIEQAALALKPSSKTERRINFLLGQDELSHEDKMLALALLNGAKKDGTIKLGGTFDWDPSKGFQAWMENALQQGVGGPLDNLITPMAELLAGIDGLASAIRVQNAIDADATTKARLLQDAQDAGKEALAARRTAGAKAMKAVQDITAFDSSTGGDLAKNDGSSTSITLNPDGTLNYNGATGVAGASSSDLAKWRAEFWKDGGLEDRAQEAAAAQRRSQRSLEAARQQVIDLGGVPAFRRGGVHRGGLRLVGEEGPELEATGPAKYYNPRQTASMMNDGEAKVKTDQANREQEKHMLEAKKDLEEQISLARQTLGALKRSHRLSESWEAGGLPPARAVL